MGMLSQSHVFTAPQKKKPAPVVYNYKYVGHITIRAIFNDHVVATAQFVTNSMMGILWIQKRTDEENITRMTEHPVAFQNLLLNGVGFPESMKEAV